MVADIEREIIYVERVPGIPGLFDAETTSITAGDDGFIQIEVTTAGDDDSYPREVGLTPDMIKAIVAWHNGRGK